MRRPHRGALWLCLFLQVLLGVPAALGLTLCVEKDGRFALEIAHAEMVSCLGESGEARTAEATLAVRVARQSCRDVPMLDNGAYEVRRCAVPPLASMALQAARLDAALLQAANPVESRRSVAVAPRSRRSVVLII